VNTKYYSNTINQHDVYFITFTVKKPHFTNHFEKFAGNQYTYVRTYTNELSALRIRTAKTSNENEGLIDTAKK